MSKPLATYVSTPLSENVQIGPNCDSLVLQCFRCEWGAGVLNLVLSLSLSHTGHRKFNMAPYAKEISEELKKELLLYIKMA